MMTSATVLVNKSPFACSVTADFDPALTLAAIEPTDMSAMSTAMTLAPYGVAQNITLELDGAGITPNQTMDQILLKDFAAFSFGSTGLSAVQIKNGFQGWMAPMGGVRAAGDNLLITGYLDVVNR